MLVMKENATYLPMSFWNQQPIELIDAGKKKHLNSLDIMALRYCAIELLSAWYEELGLDGQSNWDERNAIADDELYLCDFEGYELEEDITLRTLYMNTDHRIIASVTIDKDTYTDYLVY